LIKEPLLGKLKNIVDRDDYQQVILINGFHDKVDADLKKFNKVKKAHKNNLGYYYNTKDGNIYVKISVRNGVGIDIVGVQLLLDYNSSEVKEKFKIMAKNRNWLALYQHTKFLINLGSESVWFSFQFLPHNKKYLEKSFAIITAHNPYMKSTNTIAENNTVNKKLQKNLLKNRYVFFSSIGELSGHSEESFIVYSITLDEALEIGRKFQQESIVFNNEKVLAVVECENKLPILEVDHNKIYKELRKLDKHKREALK